VGKPVEPGKVRVLVVNFGTPCLIFATLSNLDVAPGTLGTMAGIVVAMLALFALAGIPFLAWRGWNRRTFLPPLMFGNLGNLGMPLCLFAFGQPGLELAVAAFSTQSVLFFTLGAWFISGDPSPRGLLKTPLPYAVALAMGFIATGIEPPLWLTNTTELIGGMTIPLMLITLGVSLGELRAVPKGRILVLSAARTLLGLAVGMGLAWGLDLQGALRGVVIVLGFMPSAVFNYLMALHYDREPGDVAGIVMVSTAIAFLGLPIVLAIAMSEAAATGAILPTLP
jgi:predicted permease